MAEYEIPENVDELKDWVNETERQSLEIRDDVLPRLNREISDTIKEENELLSRVKELRLRRARTESERDAAKAKAKSGDSALEIGKRKLTSLLSEEAILARLAAESEEFDRITHHHKWREFAYSHQIDGARRLATARRGILGDKRGLGKSLTSLIWADMLEAKRVLVFAPKDVLHNFEREIKHWTPHRSTAVLGGMPKIQREMFLQLLKHQEQYLLLCNYEAWRKDPDLVDFITQLKVDTVIIDEAHNIKEKKTSAFKGIKQIIYAENMCSLCGGDPEVFRNQWGTPKTRCSQCLYEPSKFNEFCSVKNVLPMTGTAILNRPQDLFTLLHLVDKVLFPDEKAFLSDYCMLDYDTNRWRFRYGGEEALISKLGSKFVRRDKKSAGVATMPQTVIAHEIEFDKTLYAEQAKVIQQIKEFGAIKMADTPDGRLDIIGILPEILRRRQAITWPAGIKIWEYVDDGDGIPRKTGRVLYEAPATESVKMDKAIELAKEIVLEEEDRLVIFSQFKEALKELEKRINALDIPVVRYDGDTPDSLAQAAQLDFDIKTSPNHATGTSCNPECVNWGNFCTGYKYQVIVAHYKKGGVGLNLNAARQMIILDREWNPGKEDQAFGRIDRMDNTQSTVVHTLHVPDSIDSFMDQLIAEKTAMIEGFESTHDLLDKMKSALQNKDLL